MTVVLDQLDKDSLVRVLTEPKNAFIKQYQCLFKMENVELIFTKEALEDAADQALERKTGARGLRAILEQTLLDVMYELPSMNGVSRCVVDTNVMLKKAEVSLLTDIGERVPIPSMEQRSA